MDFIYFFYNFRLNSIISSYWACLICSLCYYYFSSSSTPPQITKHMFSHLIILSSWRLSRDCSAALDFVHNRHTNARVPSWDRNGVEQNDRFAFAASIQYQRQQKKSHHLSSLERSWQERESGSHPERATTLQALLVNQCEAGRGWYLISR